MSDPFEGFASLEPLAGGYSGRVFLARAGEQRVVVRVFDPDDPEGPEVQAALLSLVRGLLPVPRVLEVRRGGDDRPGLLLTEQLPGERGDLVLAQASPEVRATVGSQVGDLAAVLAGMPTLSAGRFRGAALSVEPFGPHDEGLAGWVRARLGDDAEWVGRDLDRLVEVADRAQALLDRVGRTCVVHSDLNPKNLLVDRRTHRVTGLVDWEYGHSGHPFTDLGNALRLDRDPAWTEAVLTAYTARRGGEADEVRRLARAADLWALVDLAARREQNPVGARADLLLRAVAESGDIEAFPEGA